MAKKKLARTYPKRQMSHVTLPGSVQEEKKEEGLSSQKVEANVATPASRSRIRARLPSWNQEGGADGGGADGGLLVRLIDVVVVAVAVVVAAIGK